MKILFDVAVQVHGPKGLLIEGDSPMAEKKPALVVLAFVAKKAETTRAFLFSPRIQPENGGQ